MMTIEQIQATEAYQAAKLVWLEAQASDFELSVKWFFAGVGVGLFVGMCRWLLGWLRKMKNPEG